ncbi:MAG: bifunctional diguanylate cyclase/phosphodiesterase [Acidobacteria bacterium]|nr:bifunctional diguanylate cyclase/phosphodiesterase [Acidobacteriota bacterium]
MQFSTRLEFQQLSPAGFGGGSGSDSRRLGELGRLAALSSLPDRGELLRRLRAHDGPSGSAGLLLGLLVIDLQRFRSINDALGHARGDEILAEVVRRLDACRPDRSCLAWLGSARFAIFYDAFLSEKEGLGLANDLLRRLAEPCSVAGHRVVLSTVIGVAAVADSTTQPLMLLRDAETALFSAKAEGRRIVLFQPSLRFEAVARFQVENELRQAVAREEMELYFQPIVDLESRRVLGVEALLRWQHPRRGLLQPGEFLQLAREMGLGRELDLWVLREACRQLAAWRREDPALCSLTVSVNFLADNLSDPQLPEQVERILAETGLAPSDLKLECTENVRMDPARPATMARLKRMGVGLHIDDFGTGFSCLSHLHRMPAEALKVDRSFVAGVACQPAMRRLVQTILELAADLGVDVIAEGVETEEQLVALRELGCRRAQGYLFSRPQSPASLLPHLQAPC